MNKKKKKMKNEIYLKPCSHFASRCHSETIFVADRFRVHTVVMLSVTLTGAILLRSKKPVSGLLTLR